MIIKRFFVSCGSVALSVTGLLVPGSALALLLLLFALSGPETLGALSTAIWKPEAELYGLGWPLFSSILLAIPAAVLSVLAGGLAALRLVYFAGPFERRLCLTVVSVLAGLPSISVGLFALAAVTPLVGISATAGTLAIIAMIMPGFILHSEGALRALPIQLQATGACLGFTFAQQLWRVLLPAVWPVLFSGACLVLARALGEATAVSLVVGNTFSQLPPMASDTVLTLSGAILRGHKEATGLYLQVLYAAGALLMILTAVLVLVSLVVRARYALRAES